MKKIVFSLALCGAFALLGACGGGKTSASESEESASSVLAQSSVESSEQGPIYVNNAELGEYFTGMQNGNVLYVAGRATVDTTSSLSGTHIGETNAGEIIIDGDEGFAILEATGGGVGAIKAREGSSLTFKNLIITDFSAGSSSEDRREGYLEFGGKLRFENCSFNCAAYLCDDADAEFIDCEFNSGAENMYAVWISDGSAAFKDCTFEGWRAIKLYEGSDNHYTSVQPHYDVINVTVDGCSFEGLKKKPGIAIDVFQGKETSIVIKNSEFYNCQEWSSDSYEGLLTVYESRVDTSTITLVIENVFSEENPVDWETDREFGTGKPNA